ncbi:MAG: branched-chain-amino-acid transaminase [Armatimonadota bacterium]
MKVYINGRLVPQEEAKVSVFDHGLLYGDGVFEGIRAYEGRVFKLDEHIQRLYRSAHTFLIQLPISPAEMREAVLQTLRANDLRDAYIRITVSRGVGLGLDPRNVSGPATVIIITDKLSLYPKSMYENGLEVVTVSVRVPPAQAIDPRVKSLGKYINNIMAKFLANQYGAGEGLMLTVDGFVAEATGDNLFVVSDGVIRTPPASVGILEGITRNTVIELARREGFVVEERMMTLYDVYNADEAFLTGTAAEMIPMVKLDGRVIGDGKPGPVTRRLSECFRQLTREEGVPVW